MNLWEERTRETAIYPSEHALTYLGLGIASEAGEVAGKIKKVVRDDAGHVSATKRADILDEVGDVVWYAIRLCDELDTTLHAVVERNLLKLKSRKQRGVISGSGDQR